MKQNSEYRAQARAALEGRWTEAFLMILIYLFLALFLILIVPMCAVAEHFTIGWPFLANILLILQCLTNRVGFYGWRFLAIILFILPLYYGCTNALLSCLRSNEEETNCLREMWHFFRRDYSRSVPTFLLKTILVNLLSAITLGIGGVILNYAYAMVPYLLRDYPELGAREALRTSSQMMKGHKWDLFVLDLSFIGWILLGIMTAGIGLLWVAPYMDTTHAAFYEDLKNECIEEE